MKPFTRQQSGPQRTGRSRGQSGPIGVVLVLGIMITGASVVVVLGGSAIQDTEDRLSNQRAEKVMTQLDSNAALVALGNTNTQLVSLPQSSGEQFTVRQGIGWMNVTIRNETSGDVTTIANKSLGGVEYEGDDGQTIAYQGGGVWRSEPQGESIMVSPPEFHYRGATLTLPLITVDGTDSLRTRARITNQEGTTYYPNASMDPEFVNPLSEGQVNITVHSTHYQAWGKYFEDRTEGNVVYDSDAETATAELIVPFDEGLSYLLGSTEADGINRNGNKPIPDPYEEGVSYPSVDDRIESEVDDCSGSWSSPTSISSSGTYCFNSPGGGGWNVNDPDGNVTVVIDGSFNPDTLEVTNFEDDHSVEVLVRNDFDISNDINAVDGDPDHIQVLVHSDGDVDLNGNVHYAGAIIAPFSECDFNGNAYLDGGAICETIDINGNPNDFYYNDVVSDLSLGLSGDEAFITFLHISVNQVTVESG